jgi:hypothetical protein
MNTVATDKHTVPMEPFLWSAGESVSVTSRVFGAAIQGSQVRVYFTSVCGQVQPLDVALSNSVRLVVMQYGSARLLVRWLSRKAVYERSHRSSQQVFSGDVCPTWPASVPDSPIQHRPRLYRVSPSRAGQCQPTKWSADTWQSGDGENGSSDYASIQTLWTSNRTLINRCGLVFCCHLPATLHPNRHAAEKA